MRILLAFAIVSVITFPSFLSWIYCFCSSLHLDLPSPCTLRLRVRLWPWQVSLISLILCLAFLSAGQLSLLYGAGIDLSPSFFLDDGTIFLVFEIGLQLSFSVTPSI